VRSLTGTQAMTKRIPIAICAALLLVRPTFAQSSQEPASAQAAAPSAGPAAAEAPPATAAEAPAHSFLPCLPWGDPPTPSCGQAWVTAEYLFAWVQSTKLPPLVTTSPPGTDRAVAGVFGAPGTSALFEGPVNGDLRSGVRFDAGYWFDHDRIFGIEAGTMILESQATLFGASSGGTPILARPYLDATTGLPQAALIAFPGLSSGSVDIKAASGNFYEAHVDLTETFLTDGPFRLNALAGYRFFRFDDALRIGQTIFPTSGAFAAGTQLATTDSFRTHNTFNGVDLGLRGQFAWQNLTWSLLGKIAVGYVHRNVFISGSQTVSVPGAAPVTSTGGLYALSSNIGTFGSNDWGLLPEIGTNLAWQVNSNLQLRLGYSVLWLDRVARAADQIDFTVNPTLIPPAAATPTGPNRPAFVNTNRQDVWIQALSVGVTFTF
jgi:hypothetical protein